MKKQLSIILGTLSLCCLLSANIEASVSSGTLAEKGSKAKAKAKIVMPCGPCCPERPPCPPKKPPCPAEKPPCPTKKPPSPQSAYATLIYAETETDPWINALDIIVPFTSIQAAKNVTLDTATSTFTLPKGTYSINFQFVIITDGSGNTAKDNVSFLRFTNMYLDLNNGASTVALDWAMGLDDSGNMNSAPWASFSGSKIFSVAADNTVVKFVLHRTEEISGTLNIKFSSQFDIYASFADLLNNNAVRVTLHKIDDV